MNRINLLVLQGWIRNAIVNKQFSQEQLSNCEWNQRQFWRDQITLWDTHIHDQRIKLRILEELYNGRKRITNNRKNSISH